MNRYQVTIAMKTSTTGDKVFPLTFHDVCANSVEEAEEEGYARFINFIKGQINGTVTDTSIYARAEE